MRGGLGGKPSESILVFFSNSLHELGGRVLKLGIVLERGGGNVCRAKENFEFEFRYTRTRRGGGGNGREPASITHPSLPLP